jgi:hypothetical protein
LKAFSFFNLKFYKIKITGNPRKLKQIRAKEKELTSCRSFLKENLTLFKIKAENLKRR